MPYKDIEKRRKHQREYMREHRKLPIVKEREKKCRQKYNHNPDIKKRVIEYYQKPEVKERRRLWQIEWRKKNNKRFKELDKRYRDKYPEKKKARNMANNKLKHLKKKGFVFHHKDYSKPLDIIVVSIEEHRKIHNQLNSNSLSGNKKLNMEKQ